MKINIQSSFYSPRLAYAADFLLTQILDFTVVFHTDAQELEEGSLTIHYGTERPDSAIFFIPAHPFLNQKDREQPEIIVQQTNGLASFFDTPTIKNTDLSFDIFAMTFYLLSRFEEYDERILRDEHDRFPAEASIAFRNEFLNQPLLDQWAWHLYDLLKRKFPHCPERKPGYEFLPTIDVDFAWAYLNKGLERTTASFFKSLLTFQWQILARQVKVLLGLQKDPYDTFSDLEKLYQKYQVKAVFFMLLGKYAVFDKNNSPNHPAMQQLMKDLVGKAGMGIHPSYESNKNITILESELKILEKTLGKNINISRQHFLKVKLPVTYRRLITAGITTDYSMGYASATGFRASTAYPFFWYDLEKEEVTDLKIVPFAVMDVTLKNYLKLKPREALEACAKIIAETRQTGGVFCLLWHNSSFSAEMGFEEWGGVYEKIVALATDRNGRQ